MVCSGLYNRLAKQKYTGAHEHTKWRTVARVVRSWWLGQISATFVERVKVSTTSLIYFVQGNC